MRRITEREKEEIDMFLRESNNVQRMKVASDNGRPAVEPLQCALCDKFKTLAKGGLRDTFKQMVGRMAKDIMEAKGYRQVEDTNKKPVKVLVDGCLFTTASRYEHT